MSMMIRTLFEDGDDIGIEGGLGKCFPVQIRLMGFFPVKRGGGDEIPIGTVFNLVIGFKVSGGSIREIKVGEVLHIIY